MKTTTIISELLSLPIEERLMLVNSLLMSLNKPEPKIDKKWAIVAKRRLSELRTGQVKAIKGDEVFEKIWKNLSL